MEDKIIKIMQQVFNTNDITPATDQTNCDQWDSLRHLNLVMAIEDEFDVEFDPEEIATMKSFSAVTDAINSKLS